MVNSRFLSFPRPIYQQQFATSFQQLRESPHNVLVFYGEDGLGKTTLSNLIKKAYRSQSVVLPGTAMKQQNHLNLERVIDWLDRRFAEDGIRLKDFDVVYAYYRWWVGLSPSFEPDRRQGQPDEQEIAAHLVQLGSAIAQDVQAQIPMANTLTTLTSLALQYMQQPERHKELLQQFKELPHPYALLEELPAYLVRVLEQALVDDAQQVAILIDGYEDLLDKQGRCSWLEEMMAIAAPSVLWVLFAEDKITALSHAKQVQLEPLDYEESLEWVRSLNISDLEIAQTIAIAAKGIPFDLTRRVELYQQTQTTIATSREAVLQQLMQGWNPATLKVLRILAFARSWDQELLSAIVQQQQLGDVQALLSEVLALPDVESVGANQWRLHSLMAQHLQGQFTTLEQASMHQWLYAFARSRYTKQAKSEWLEEAVYHGLRGNHPEEASHWVFQQVVQLQARFRHVAAIAVLQLMKELASRLSIEVNAQATTQLGVSQAELGKVEAAIATLEQAKEMQQADAATVEFYLAQAYFQAGRFFDAQNAALQAKRLRTEQFGERSLEVAAVLTLLAKIAVQREQEREAFTLTQQALEIYSSHSQESPLAVIKLKQTQADLLCRLDRLDEAKQACSEALELAVSALGATHPESIICRGMLGFVYARMGAHKYEDAYEQFTQALALGEEVLGVDHPQVLSLLRYLTSLCRKMGRMEKAEEFAQRHNAQVQIGRFDHTLEAAQRMSDLGMKFFLAGEYGKAEPMLVRSLAIYEDLLGEQHHHTAVSLNNLAELYKAQGRYEETASMLVRSLAICKQLFGERHCDTAGILNNLAELYRSQGQDDKAEPMLARSLAIYQQLLGKQHPDTTPMLNNLAALYKTQGRYGEAEALYQQSLAISEQQAVPNARNTAITLSNLAELYRTQGRYTESEPLHLRSLAICEQHLGPQHPDTSNTLLNLAELYRAQGRYCEAEPLYLRSLAIREQQLGELHPSTAEILNGLAGFYHSQGLYAQAEPLYLRAIEIAKGVLGINHPDTQVFMRNLESMRQEMRSQAPSSP